MVVFFYTTFKCDELKISANIDIPSAPIASTNSIPGLVVIDNFISPEEEQAMLSEIDAQKWTKLLNRRVQHYGYEFKYGTNNVDTQEKMGALPSFCDPVLSRLEKAT